MKKSVFFSFFTISSCIKFVVGIFFLFFGFFSSSYAYLFGMKSFDNTVENIVNIEKEFGVYLPIVSFIYDPWEQWEVIEELHKMKRLLGGQRVYHITISPNNLSAKEVAAGKFDAQYAAFFRTIKELNLKVIFRTMHEMNGGWYPWSSNPEAFKQAWIHVWQLSRHEGLDQSDILFDFSVNGRDLPARGGIPSQKAVFIHCEPQLKIELACPSMEDYYPGAEYVDIVGFTFYNWGKGNSNRWRGSPDRIINNKTWQTLERIKQFGKPMFVDEVGTTAVNYTGDYDYHRSLQMYQQRSDLKNLWLGQLKDFLKREKSIVGAVYFNVDLTNGLQYQIIGELDWAIINLVNGKFYQGFWDLYSSANVDLQPLFNLFGVMEMQVNGKRILTSLPIKLQLEEIDAMVTEKYPNINEKSLFYKRLSSMKSSDARFNKVIELLADAYSVSSALNY